MRLASLTLRIDAGYCLVVGAAVALAASAIALAVDVGAFAISQAIAVGPWCTPDRRLARGPRRRLP